MSYEIQFKEFCQEAYGSPFALSAKFGGIDTIADFLRALKQKHDVETCLTIFRAIVEVADFEWFFKSKYDKNACIHLLSGAQLRLGGCIVALRLASADGIRHEAPFTLMQFDEKGQYSARHVFFDAKTGKFSIDSRRTRGLSHESLGVVVDMYVRRVENGHYYSLPEKCGDAEYASYDEED